MLASAAFLGIGASWRLEVEPFKPYVPANKHIPEFTIIPVLMGIVLGIVFGASSLYLALKVGLTVSASIPIAVLSITLFRGFSWAFGLRRATILENNITQTTGSAGESLAFGVAVTLPALLILGFEMEVWRATMVALLGSALGILFMIPLRRALIVAGHGQLPYPEGTACARVLIAGEERGTTARLVFSGFIFALVYKVLGVGMRLWHEIAGRVFGWFKGASVSVEVSPELLGVGYIIGPQIASIMVAGGLVSSWILIPMIKLFGDGLTAPLFPATDLISNMGPKEIWRNYVLYIGAGAVAAAGIISLIESAPTIVHGAREGMKGFKRKGKSEGQDDRTEQDLPLSLVFFGCAAIVLGIWWTPSLHMNLLGALLIIVFGLLFVTVSSRLVGEVGTSSNPVSGMTVATILFTSFIFLMLGWTSPQDRVTALSIAAVVCIAVANAGTTSQDLKTGFLVGATPKFQQIAVLIGAISSAVVIGYTLDLLNRASTVYTNKNLPAVVVPNPQSLTEMEQVQDPVHAADTTAYHVLRVPEIQTDGPLKGLVSGKYLVDDTGKIRYLVDPGINGTLERRDDQSLVQKYDAPKARLMSLIIDGILAQKLPWALVFLGVALTLAAKVMGVPALTFAVGIYLPLSTSAPIFLGGMVRWFVQRRRWPHPRKHEDPTESSGGVLYASGLIAGGAIAGISIAIGSLNREWMEAVNLGRFIPGVSESGWAPVAAFAVMAFLLGRVGLASAGGKKAK